MTVTEFRQALEALEAAGYGKAEIMVEHDSYWSEAALRLTDLADGVYLPGRSFNSPARAEEVRREAVHVLMQWTVVEVCRAEDIEPQRARS